MKSGALVSPPNIYPPRLKLSNSGAPRAREVSASGAPQLRKFGKSIHSRKFGYDVSVRPPVRTDAGRGGRESEVSPSGEGDVIAEVKFCISRTSLVSAVNHMAAPGF